MWVEPSAGPSGHAFAATRDRAPLSVFVVSYNRSALLRTCLKALGFADEIVVIDKSSTDDSVAVAESLADRVVSVPWSPTVEETRAFALAQCSHEWVLCLDDDECLSTEAVEFIDAELRAPRADIYILPLRHYILGRHDERAYYWPEAHPRLFRRGAVAFRDTVHAGLVALSEHRFDVPAATGACIHHLSHRDAAEWIAKTNRYTSRPDRKRAEHDGADLIAFAHDRLDAWMERSGDSDRGDYPAAVAVLRAVYDMVDRVKAWEEAQGLDGSALFERAGERLERAYAERLGHLRRPRRSKGLHLIPSAGPPPAHDGREARLRRVVETLGAALRDARAAAGREAAAADALRAELEALRAELEALRGSTFWRATGPLRRLVELARVTRFPWRKRSTHDLPYRREEAGTGIDRFTELLAMLGPELIRFPQAAEPAVSVIVPTFGKAEYTLRCLASMARNLPNAPIEVIVVDDASGDPEAAALARVRGIRLVTNETNLGFLRTCNAAARIAAGRHLLFLNNDTEVLPGWLDPMVALLDDRADAGAVGSMLLFPDGRLQEAGGIIWRDGTGWTFGRGDDPEKPKYNYVREVDYASGASLLVRRALFHRLGGFDEAYAPAYCEDSDLAFRIREAGLKVLYQPLSRVVHHEGVSNGTDPARGVKRFNDINQRKLAARWRDVLAAEHFPPGEQVLRARERGHDRRFVLVAGQSAATAGQMAAGFAEAGLLVKLWARDPAGAGAGALRQRGVDVLPGGPDDALREWIAANAAGLDGTVLADADAAEAFLADLRLGGGAPVLYRASGEPDWRERQIWRRVDAVLHRSEAAAREAGLLEPGAEPVWAEPLAAAVCAILDGAAPARRRDRAEAEAQAA